jgi:hypothetical protein
MPDKPKQLIFGPVIVEWDPPYLFPILIDLSKHNWFVTQCEIRYRYGKGDYFLPIRAGYGFDGASIPWLIRIVPGFAKLDWHLIAALPHDYVIDHPELLPRSVADGIFVSVLVALAENRKDANRFITKVQGYLMYFAVWTWTTIVTRIRHPPNNYEAKPPEQVLQAPPTAPCVEKEEAVSIVKEETKEQTSTPPPPIAIVKTPNGVDTVRLGEKTQTETK